MELVQLNQNLEQRIAIGKRCFKIRIAIASKEQRKSGGAGIIINIMVTDATVYLLSIHNEAEKEYLKNKELLKYIP